jgi:hypothetical protein
MMAQPVLRPGGHSPVWTSAQPDYELIVSEMKAAAGARAQGDYGLMVSSRLSAGISVFLLGLSTSW